MASHGIWFLRNWHIVCTDYKLCKVCANIRMHGMENFKINMRVFSLKLSTPLYVLLSFHDVRMYSSY